jgi:REP element-mobilizing transposase RayT
MARQPRIEYAGALHHVMSRGNDGISIFRDDDDRRLFLQLLDEEVARSRWILHDYCLMGNHYHFTIETPECTLSIGMHHLLGRYVQRFNRRHRRRGHLFQERFKNVLVEVESQGLELSRYIALNPVRAGLAERPERWEWSSYAARAGFAKSPQWLTLDPLLSQFGPDRASQQVAYREFVLEKILAADDLTEKFTAAIYLGTAQWFDRVQRLLDEHERSEEHPRAQVHPGRPDLEGVMDAVATTFDTTPEAIHAGRGTLERRFVAWFAFEEGLVPLRRIARELGVTSAGGISRLISRCRRELRDDPEIRAIAEACRGRMRRRPPPFIFPPQVPPLTARRYHRAPSRSRR